MLSIVLTLGSLPSVVRGLAWSSSLLRSSALLWERSLPPQELKPADPDRASSILERFYFCCFWGAVYLQVPPGDLPATDPPVLSRAGQPGSQPVSQSRGQWVERYGVLAAQLWTSPPWGPCRQDIHCCHNSSSLYPPATPSKHTFHATIHVPLFGVYMAWVIGAFSEWGDPWF